MKSQVHYYQPAARACTAGAALAGAVEAACGAGQTILPPSLLH